ncbi:MAG: cytochrome c3 family protein [Gallionella sp.]
MLLRLVLLTLSLSLSGVALGAGESALMPGKVISGHAKLEAKCEECHVKFNKAAQSKLCKDCHKEVGADVQNRKGFHGRLEEKPCRECHTDHKGRGAKIVLLDTNKFDHEKTDFPLHGTHQKQDKVKCKDCHKQGKKYSEAPSACIGCHLKDDKHKGSLGKECTNCHTETNWKEAKFDHSKTKFALKGKHVDVKCKKCHAETPTKYKGASMECVSCHRKDDKHKGNYGKKCENCHVDRSWKTIEFNHNKETKFKLLGKHDTVKCLSCHKEPLYGKVKTPSTCIACHRKDDIHKGGLGQKCETCHNEEKWKTAKFDHDKDTKFPLNGKHITTKCDACHTPALKLPGTKEKIATTCIGCHKIDDKHKGNFGTKCESCHKEKDWKSLIFDHDKDTKYPLKFKHKEVKCVSCHIGKLYGQKLAMDCYSCHKKDDDKVHKLKLGKKCESCHTEKDWKKETFDHARSRFPLLGSHQTVDCKKCHKTQLYLDTPTDCYSCHKKDDDKVHKRRLGKKCESCHNARSWKVWDFNHDTRTKFKLDGGHKKIDCYACHKAEMEDRVIVAKSCGGCHDNDDVHRGEFGPLCDRCHGTSKWRTLLIGKGSPRR